MERRFCRGVVLLLALCPLAFAWTQAPAAEGAAESLAIDVVVCVEASAISGSVLQVLAGPFWDGFSRALISRADVRAGLVVYRTDGPDLDVRVQEFSSDLHSIARVLARLGPGGGEATESSAPGVLAAAFAAVELGGWRPDARRLVVLVARNSPARDRAELESVLQANRSNAAASVLAVLLPGASTSAVRAFSELASRSAGLVSSASQLFDVPELTAQLLSVLVPPSTALGDDGVVARVIGRHLEAQFSGRQPPLGSEVLVLSRETPGLVIASGSVTATDGGDQVIETTATYTTEEVVPGCRVRLVSILETP